MNNVVIGGATVTIGSDLGYIKDGITINPTAEHYFVEDVEGYPGRHAAKRIRENYAISFTLIEPTQANIKIGWDVTNAPAGTDPITLEFGSDSVTPQERVLVVTGVVPGVGGFVRTVQFDRAIIEDPGEMKITDFEESKLPVTMTCLYDSTNSRVGQFSDAAS